MPKLETLHFDSQTTTDVLDKNLLKQMQFLNAAYHAVAPEIKEVTKTVGQYNATAIAQGGASLYFLVSKAAKEMADPKASIYPLHSFNEITPVAYTDIEDLYQAASSTKLNMPTNAKDKNLFYYQAPALLCSAAASYVAVRAALSIAVLGTAQQNNGNQMPQHMAGVLGQLSSASGFIKQAVSSITQTDLLDGTLPKDFDQKAAKQQKADTLKLYKTTIYASRVIDSLEKSLKPIVQSHIDVKISGLGRAETLEALKQVNQEQEQNADKVLH